MTRATFCAELSRRAYVDDDSRDGGLEGFTTGGVRLLGPDFNAFSSSGASLRGIKAEVQVEHIRLNTSG